MLTQVNVALQYKKHTLKHYEALVPRVFEMQCQNQKKDYIGTKSFFLEYKRERSTISVC